MEWDPNVLEMLWKSWGQDGGHELSRTTGCRPRRRPRTRAHVRMKTSAWPVPPPSVLWKRSAGISTGSRP